MVLEIGKGGDGHKTTISPFLRKAQEVVEHSIDVPIILRRGTACRAPTQGRPSTNLFLKFYSRELHESARDNSR